MLAILDISTGYQLLGLLHVLAVIVAFGPLFIYPSMQRAGAGAALAKLHLRLMLPALTLVVGARHGPRRHVRRRLRVSQTWILLALIGWVILMLVSWFLIRPALTDTSDDGQEPPGAGIGVTHLLLVVMLYLMIFKPGL